MQPPEFEESLDSLDSFSEKLWAQVPEPIRKDVEQHVAAHLPDNLLTKLRDLNARGIPISSDDAFFHFGGGMAVRNLCRERLSDKELATYCLYRQLGWMLYWGSSSRSLRCVSKGSSSHDLLALIRLALKR
jgi:hypothetical protein